MRPSLLCSRYNALTSEALARLAAAKWKLGDDKISKRFAMSSHTSAARFAASVAEHADRLNHHPEIHIKYRFVNFELRSNDVGRLSEMDERLAVIIDSLRPPK